MQTSLLTIQAIRTRVTEYQKPPSMLNPSQQKANVESLPRLAPNLRQGQIFVSPSAPSTPMRKIESTIGNLAKSLGQSPPSRNITPVGLVSPLVSPRVKKLSNLAGQKLLTQSPGQQSEPQPTSFKETFNTYLKTFIQSPLGYPFRQPFARRIDAVVFGTAKGYSDVFVILNAIEALSVLTLSSLKEDPYGNVANDVGGIMKAYVLVLGDLTRFADEMEVHWTDYEGRQQGGSGSGSDDVELVCMKLKEGLASMVEAFEPYATDFGIDGNVIRMVRGALMGPR